MEARLKDIHKKLLTDISDEMTVGSQEYDNFIEHMTKYVRKGLLAGKKTLLGKFDALKSKGHLEPGHYETLKEICTSSGNVDIRWMIEKAEKEIGQLKRGINTIESEHEDPVQNKKPRLDLKLNELRTDLVEKYCKYYIKTEFIPWKPEEDQINIDKIYSPLYMQRKLRSSEKANTNQRENQKVSKQKENQRVTKQTGKQGVTKQTKMSSIHELFACDIKCHKKILVIAESGAGKTTLCRKLISLWCDQFKDIPETEVGAHADLSETFVYVVDEDSCRENENMESFMFDFLFYVSLRHAKQEEYIEDMIVNQLEIKEEDLQKILDTTKCLVIVDGLDEWLPLQNMHYGPMNIKGCPKEKHIDRFYTLYTTRPWKLVEDARDANTSKLQLHYQLKGLESCEEMIAKYAQLIKTKHDFSQEQFLIDVENKSHFLSSPLLLKLMMFLWAENGRLEESICKLYGKVVELLIRSGLERNTDDNDFMEKVNRICAPEDLIPTCFKGSNDFPQLSKYFSAMKQVGKISFETLLKGTLQLKNSDVQMYEQKYDIDLIFLKKLGLFSQTPQIGGSSLDRSSEVAFIHKSFQEFYAAIHVVSYPEECYKVLEAKWSKMDEESVHAKALVLSDVFKFVCGMDSNSRPEMYKLIFKYACIEGSVEDEDDFNYGDFFNFENLGDRMPVGNENRKCKKPVLVKEQIHDELCNTCDEFSYGPVRIFHDHVIGNIEEMLSCGYKDFSLPISDFTLCTCLQGRRTFQMLKCLKYLDASTLERLVLKILYGKFGPCFYCSEPNNINLPDLCYEWSLVFPFILSVKCTNLREIKLNGITLTYKQLANIVLSHPSKLEVIKLDSIEVINKDISVSTLRDAVNAIVELGHLEKEEAEKILQDESLKEASFSEINLSTSFCFLRELFLQDIGVITHSQITHMLTDSPSLQTVEFTRVYSEEDSYCGCEKVATDEANQATVCLKASTKSFVKTLNIADSKNTLSHVKVFPQLEHFCLRHKTYWNGDEEENKNYYIEKLTPSQIINCLKHSPSLKSFTYRGDSVCVQYNKESCDGDSRLVACCTEENLKLLEKGNFSYSRFNNLKVVTLKMMDITHSYMTYILSLPHIERVDLSKLVCQPDSHCGCKPEADKTVEFLQVKSRLQELVIHEGSEDFTHVFTHVSDIENLKKLCFSGRVVKIESVLFKSVKTSHCFEEALFCKEDRYVDSDDYMFGEAALGEHCKIAQNLLLEFIECISKCPSTKTIKLLLDRVKLTNENDKGDADYVHQRVSEIENISIQRFTKWELHDTRIVMYENEDGDVSYDEDVDFHYSETSSQSDTLSMTLQVHRM